MKILIVKFNGGLGNQLFQYAAARCISINKNLTHIYFDVRHYNSDYLGRKAGIQQFNVQGKILKSKIALKAITRNTKFNRIISFLGLYKEVIEENFKLHDLTKTGVITTLTGFWQSYKYFEDIRPVILKEFSLKSSTNKYALMSDIISANKTVSIHVRRKDYLLDERYGFLGKLYYENAISFIKINLNYPFKFLVFSDDSEWCRQNICIGEDVTFIADDYIPDYESLLLMSQCHHQIIANSSFSWWAAWLNNNPDKIVIRPARPFNDPSLLYEDHYPESWIPIEG